MTPRPLVKRTPDGRRYLAPSRVPDLSLRPRSEDAEQPASGPGSPSGATRGRHGVGRAKLSDDDVRALRADYATGKWSYADLAYIYGVGAATARNVVCGFTYTHVKTPPAEQES